MILSETMVTPVHQKKEILLKAENINLSFGEKVVLKDVNLQIRNIVRPGMYQGQIVSLIGRSGSGKTQLLRILGGLNKPTSGAVHIGIDQTPVQAGDMGLVPQDYFLFPWRKVKTILELAGERNPAFKDHRILRQAVDYYINHFELKDHVDKFPAQLSGGQKQRVSIAQQILNGSNFLLMDEPFSGLDTLMIDKTTSMLTDITTSDELKTIILVSHDLSNSVAISDTVFLLSNKHRDPAEGATIVKEICLIDRGLAWDPEIKERRGFHDTLKEIKSYL